ncbi:hypothetical protein U0070_014437 [Myodes glareolus]|uniref:Uncharacterized protein n=1 Tax=Myodes glareolus TaxID=447135 RepID=A0AAW0J700_MYOGA
MSNSVAQTVGVTWDSDFSGQQIASLGIPEANETKQPRFQEAMETHFSKAPSETADPRSFLNSCPLDPQEKPPLEIQVQC